MAAISVTGRVLSVRPRPDGRFGVTLGPGPDCYWYVAYEPPDLGQEIRVHAERWVKRPVATGATQGTLTLLMDADAESTGERPRRVVAPQWAERAQVSMGRPLFRYQVEGAAWLAQCLAAGRGAILADEPGAGKSAQAIAALFATGMLPAIIVCPASLKKNWERELGWSAYSPRVELISKREGFIAEADVYVINYELIRHREQQLAELGARAIVFDEAHELKEPRARLMHRASVGTRLADWIGRPILLTGTPMLNRPSELWRLLRIVEPHQWPKFEEFYQRYCKAPEEDELEPRPDQRIITSVGRAEHLDELKARVQPVMLRRLKSEVLPDLPPRSRRSVLVQLDTYDMAEYRAAEANVVAWLRAQGSWQLASRAQKTEALVKLTYLRRLAALGKLRSAVPEYIQRWFDRTEREPLVIFGFHRDVLRGSDGRGGVMAICMALGLRIASITGTDSGERRQEEVDRFQDGDADVFIAPIKSAGVGLNLHRASETLFLERVWVPALLVQAEERTHRIGQDRPVTATYLDAADTIDERMAVVLGDKHALVSKVLDDVDTEASAFGTVLDVLDLYAQETTT